MNNLLKQYNPHEHEERIYQRWEEAGVFKPDAQALKKGKAPFVIMLPLPNITGSLHMGHALQDSIMDALIRYHRMAGEPTLWQPGMDHAGIATQNVVEKELRKEGTTRHDLGREKFLERVWQWKEQSGNTIAQQMKRLGCSCDWSRSVFTMDPAYVHAVHETFIRYHERGYIYRGNRIVNWCPRCASVISDLEIKHESRETQLFTLRYPVKSPGAITGHGPGDVPSAKYIDVSTTRPETMLGDTAVAVNPQDERYQRLAGRYVRLPLVNREVPIIADDRIDASFGTGAVKVTPAHDHLDAALAATHHLDSINVIGEDGRLTAAAGTFAGQTVASARAVVIAALEQAGALISTQDYRHDIALCERCGTVIEPLLSRQWFVDMSKLKDETIQVAEDELIKFFPSRWQQHFLEWMNNVHDWTISRQLWWGQSIPVWWQRGIRGTERENEPGAYVVAVDKPTAGDWEQDPDVLDTWFSSALWPFATLGWPEATRDLKTFYPTSVLVTARDIVYLWVARMIFSGLELLKDTVYDKPAAAQRIPFKDVFIYPTVLSKNGQRMSKSLGTGVDPLVLIETYGADATRFGLLYQLTYDSQALKFDEAAIISGRNFANKLWNIARLLHSLPERDEASVADQWITARAGEVITAVTQHLQNYKLGEAVRLLHAFVWDDFADWYIEILKVEGSVATALATFDQILALLHPFMPHITEVLWAEHAQPTMLAVSAWPQPTAAADSAAIATLARFKDIVTTTRQARSLLEIAPGDVIDLAVDEPPLPAALTVLTKVTLVPADSSMKVFPLAGGGTLALGGKNVSATAITRAQEKLRRTEAEATQLVAHLTTTLEKMASKASAERMAVLTAEREQASKKLLEIRKSLELLQ